jgi:DNA polymerase
MTRRELILRELGLVQWRLREAGAAEQVLADDSHCAPAAVRDGDRPAAARTPHTVPAGDEERSSAIAGMDWMQLEASVRGCAACPLHARRKQSVFGVGDQQADWLFVGEGPGSEEDERGEPFVGQAGRLLDNMLASIGLRRGQDAYIANVVKCRPPGNRVPEPGEAAQCEPYLLRQIELIQPKLVIALGKTAALSLLGTEASIASLRGRVHDLRGRALLVTYHPAYLLRNLPDKAKAWEDLCMARELMAQLKAGQSIPT